MKSMDYRTGYNSQNPQQVLYGLRHESQVLRTPSCTGLMTKGYGKRTLDKRRSAKGKKLSPRAKRALSAVLIGGIGLTAIYGGCLAAAGVGDYIKIGEDVGNISANKAKCNINDAYPGFANESQKSVEEAEEGQESYDSKYPKDHEVKYPFGHMRLNLSSRLNEHFIDKRYHFSLNDRLLFVKYNLYAIKGDAEACRNLVQPFYDDKYSSLLSDTEDEPAIGELLSSLSRETGNNESDNLARRLISFVQNGISYDNSSNGLPRYPYQVLFDGRGDCDEKSLLLVKGLNVLGYKTGLFLFYNSTLEVGHAAAGIGVPPGYGSFGTDLCFIETTEASQKGYINGTYLYNGKKYSLQDLDETPKVIYLNTDGKLLIPQIYRDPRSPRGWN